VESVPLQHNPHPKNCASLYTLGESSSNMYSSSTLLASSLVASALAYDVPSNVKNFYNSVKSAGQCSDKLATGFYSYDGGPNSMLHRQE
jgi:hypothetical protein